MIFLILSIMCSASIALIFKHSEGQGFNRYAVTSANYAAASLVSAGILILGDFQVPADFTLGGAWDLLKAEFGGELSNQAGMLWAVLVGLGAGVFFFLGFIYYQISVKHHGPTLAGAFIKLGALAPLVFSLVLWREHPLPIQWVGILLAFASIILANWPDEGKGWRDALRPALLCLLVFGGIAEFSNKVFQNYGLLVHKSLFLMTTFTVALLLSLFVTVQRNRASQLDVGARDIWMGVAVGIPNLFTSFFLILALEDLLASVVFPIFAAGSILVIHLVDFLIYKTKLKPFERAAVALILIALVLINLA